MYQVEFLLPDDASRGLTLSIETLMDQSPKAISCKAVPMDGWGDANLHVACGFPEDAPDRYALLFWGETPNVDSWGRNVIASAFLTVFASPEHLNREKKKWAGTKFGCSPVSIPPAVDVELFADEGGPRSGALWVGPYESRKGLRKAVDWANERGMTLDVYGIGRPFLWLRRYQGDIINLSDWGDNIRIRDDVPYLQMPEVYNQHKTLVSLPMWFDPCPRACIEATLCGCKVVTNAENGFASWDRDWRKDSAREFWDTLMKAASGGG